MAFEKMNPDNATSNVKFTIGTGISTPLPLWIVNRSIMAIMSIQIFVVKMLKCNCFSNLVL